MLGSPVPRPVTHLVGRSPSHRDESVASVIHLLRADQSMAFSFARSVGEGSGRETLRICPTSDLRFRFDGNRPPPINEGWVCAVLATAKAPTGLRMVPD